MSETHNIERQGTSIVIERLERAGRTVSRSKRKTFDLIVDGLPAEIKCKQLPWAKLDFIGLTDGQRRALDRGERFILFVVCNLKVAGQEEVIEIPSEALSHAKFRVESTHYIYGSELRLITNAPNQGAAANRRPAGQSDGSGNLSATVAADRAFPAAVAELGR